MAAAKPAGVNLAALYSELNKLGENEDFARAIKVAKKILKDHPNETKAQHCLVVSYIREKDFVNALNSITRNLAEALSFEKAYCLYRQNKNQEALAVLNAEAEPQNKHKELRAQIYYRLERFEECLDIYKDLIRNSQDDSEVERATNLSAVVACLSLEGKDAGLEVPDESYEQRYNAALRLLGQGKVSEAEALLRSAETLCRQTLEEDGAGEDEVEEELPMIHVQLGYALHLQGRTAEAQQLYQKVLKTKPDLALVAIAANNSAMLNGTQNVFDSRRKLKMTKTVLDAPDNKLTAKQRQALAVNQCLFLGLTSQAEQCRKSVEQLRKDATKLPLEVALLQAWLDAKANRFEEALAALAELGGQADAALTSGLARLQLLLERRDVERAAALLKQLLVDHFSLGLLGALVSLLAAGGQRAPAVALVDDALQRRDVGRLPLDTQVKLLRQAAAFHFKGGDAPKAAHCLQRMIQLQPSTGDAATLARLVLLQSQFEPAEALKTSRLLPPAALDAGLVDVDALESATWALGLKHAARKMPAAAASGAASPASAAAKKATPGSDKTKKSASGEKDKTRKKTKKKRLPKNCDAGVAPDPERWLPRRERSTYRPKKRDRRHGRDGRADVGKGTQGTSAAALEMQDKFDMSKMKTALKSTAAPAPSTASTAAATSGPSRSTKAAQQKKKNRKGKF